MSRDGLRFQRANAAAVFAFALVVYFTLALRVTIEDRQPSVEEVGQPPPVAMLDAESLPSAV